MKTLKDYIETRDNKTNLLQTKISKELNDKTRVALKKLGWSVNDLIEAACRQAIDQAKSK